MLINPLRTSNLRLRYVVIILFSTPILPTADFRYVVWLAAPRSTSQNAVSVTFRIANKAPRASFVAYRFAFSGPARVFSGRRPGPILPEVSGQDQSGFHKNARHPKGSERSRCGSMALGPTDRAESVP